jgi:hypothetical protein
VFGFQDRQDTLVKMIYLSLALVLIFVLYLIDKNNAWKGAAKIAGGLVALVALAAVAVYGWLKYDDWKAERKRKADVMACMKSVTEGTTVFVRDGEEINNVVKSFCESNPGAKLACGLKTDSNGNLTVYAIGDTDKDVPGKICTAKGWEQSPIVACAEKVRTLYPAEYADLDDLTLGRKTLAKFPTCDIPRPPDCSKGDAFDRLACEEHGLPVKTAH